MFPFKPWLLILFSLIQLSGAVVPAAPAARRSMDLSKLPPPLQQEVLKAFPQLSAGAFNLQTVDDVIRYLQLRPDFDSVQVYETGEGQYQVRTERSTRIASIKYQGIKAMSESEAKALFGINANDLLNQEQLISGGERLRLQYHQMGYRNATIDLEIPRNPKGNVDLVVKMNEGVQTQIGSFVFLSPNTDLNKALQGRLSRFKGYALTDSQLADVQKKIREYLNSKFYVRTEITGPEVTLNADESKAELTFKLDKVDSYALEFFGNREVSTSTLSQSLDLGNFYSANPNVGSELAGKIKAVYLSRGFARAEVQGDEAEGKKPFTRKVRFNIDEGPKIKIAHFNFSGNISRTPEYYSKLLAEQSSSLIQKGYYNKADLDTGFESFRVELQNQGFLLAKINSTRTQYNKERTEVSIFVNLDEGPITQVTEVKFTGNTSLTAAELLPVVEIAPGKPLRLGQVEKAIQNLRTYYQEKGFIEMALLNEKEDLVTYNEDNTQATIHFKLTEGPQVRIASIVLDGNNFTKDYVLLNRIDLQNGDILTPSKVEEATAKLQRAGYFNTVEIRTLEEKTSVANRTLIIKVVERDPGIIIIGAGATNDLGFTVRGYTDVGYNNLFGTGRGISFRTEGSYNVTQIKYPEYKASLEYVEPYLFQSKFRGRVNLTRSSLLTDYNIRKISDVYQTTYSVERDITSHVTATYDIWNGAHVKDFGLDPARPIDTPPQDIVTTGPTLAVDYRDNVFNPTRGNFSKLSVEYSSPEIGSSSEPNEIRFMRTQGSYTQYNRLPYFKNDFMVWANSVRGGYLKNLSRDGGVPYDKKGFYLGGGSTIRGFVGASDYFPNYDQLGIKATDTYFLKTSASMYLVKSEIRIPLYGDFGAALFYDGGAVYIENRDMGDVYRDSAGFGLHYNTPFGPVNLEFAWKLDAKEGEDPFAFHLSIGTF
jgi:outer membrane protein assembly complex protein YaeT